LLIRSCPIKARDRRQNCPTKSVNAQAIENEVLKHTRTIYEEPKFESHTWEKLTLKEQIPIIQSIIKRIYYDRENKLLDITLNNNHKQFSFKSEIKHGNTSSSRKNRRIKKEPPLRRNLVLAYQISNLIEEGKARDLKEVATWLNMSHQRINQMINLLLLAPAIQEDIILSEKKFLFHIPEYKMREIIIEVNWEKQIKMWSATKL